jgi:protocatechuate 3,4-dioxygenase beta subunit
VRLKAGRYEVCAFRSTAFVLTFLTFFLAFRTPAAGQNSSNPQPVQGIPARDQRQPAQTGTAIIRGRVLAADTGRPLRRARITVRAPELGSEPRMTSTNLDGKYEVNGLPAGRYTISVTRSGYLTLQYGQRRPLEPGKPLQVGDKQAIENVDFTLPRTSVITGRITDETGEPVADVPVFAMRSSYWQGRRRYVPSGPPARTDDAGQYRIVGLVPGTYYVMAMLRETWTMTENGVEMVMGYSPTYYPGTATVASARRITVGVGQEAGATDFALPPGRTATVSGTGFDSAGRPLAARTVSITQEIVGPNGGTFMTAGNAMAGADGSFSIKNVAPGEYTLRTQTTTPGSNAASPAQESATRRIVVDGGDINNIVLTTAAGWSISGQLTTEGGIPPPAPRDRFRLAAHLVNTDMTRTAAGPGNADSGRVREDWTFMVTGILGAVRLRATVPDGWAVKAILHDGRDISDEPFEMRGNEELTGVQVVITDRVTSVSGQLRDDQGAPLPDGTIIVFADDAEKWSEESRWVRSTRPDQDGQYQIRGLPPGQYVAVAVDYVEDGMWNDPEYLESIRRFGQRLTLSEAGSQTLSLKLVTP